MWVLTTATIFWENSAQMYGRWLECRMLGLFALCFFELGFPFARCLSGWCDLNIWVLQSGNEGVTFKTHTLCAGLTWVVSSALRSFCSLSVSLQTETLFKLLNVLDGGFERIWTCISWKAPSVLHQWHFLKKHERKRKVYLIKIWVEL